MIKRLIYISLFLMGNVLFSQYTSPFNKNRIENSETGDYAFMVSGHFHGGSNNQSHFPANTLLANLDWINNSESEMLICLGDLFKDISKEIPNYEKSFFSQLNIPLVNTVGNHDLTGSIYQDNYGETSFLFELNNDLHLILDTERDNGNIEEEQLELLEEALSKVNENQINNVFLYMHRTIWKSTYSEMEGIFEDNTQALGGNNFESDVFPLLKKIGKKTDVHLFSGSLGTAPASFFNYNDTENNIQIIATAIRALPRDAMLQVIVKNGNVTFKTKSLTNQTVLPLENYTVDYWQNEVGEEPFNWKLSLYYVQLMLTHRYFWFGVITTILVVVTFLGFRRRRIKKSAK